MLLFYLSMLDDEDDKVKLEKIFNDHYQMMLKTAYYITKHEDYAKFAVSDALLKIVKYINEIRTDNDEELAAFIHTVTKNAALNVLRDKNKDITLLNIDDYAWIPSSDDISDEVESNETHMRIINKINQMPSKYNDILVLRYVHSLSIKSISKITKINPSTVRVRIKRGTKMLRDILYGKGENNE